jgi:hypothetical protein
MPFTPSSLLRICARLRSEPIRQFKLVRAAHLSPNTSRTVGQPGGSLAPCEGQSPLRQPSLLEYRINGTGEINRRGNPFR